MLVNLKVAIRTSYPLIAQGNVPHRERRQCDPLHTHFDTLEFVLTTLHHHCGWPTIRQLKGSRRDLFILIRSSSETK